MKDDLEMNLGMGLGFEEDLKDEFDNELFLHIVNVVFSVFTRKFSFLDKESYHFFFIKIISLILLHIRQVKFQSWFRMRREIFLSNLDSVVKFNPWFSQRLDALICMGLSTLQKCTSVI